MATINVKRGDTLSLDCTRTDSAGSVVPLSGSGAAEMTSFVNDTTISLNYSVLDAGAGQFRVSAPAAETINWSLGVYHCDIEFTVGSDVQSTETFLINVTKDITNAP